MRRARAASRPSPPRRSLKWSPGARKADQRPARTGRAARWRVRWAFFDSSVGRIWRSHGLELHRVESSKISNDPNFAEKLEDIVGLYLNPIEHALVLSFDEKSQIQALDRTQPGLPTKKGRGQAMTHDYKRNGTTTLFPALNAVTGGLRSVSTTASSSRVAEVSAPDRLDGQCEEADPHHLRQLCHAQASACKALAGRARAISCAFHAHLSLMVEHDRALLSRSDREKSPTRRVPRARTTHRGRRRLHRPSQ